MAGVRFDTLEKSYGEVRIIKGVDLDVSDGEFLVLVGPSGCGKSTMLRCVAGLEEITGGKLSIGDRVVNDVQPRDRGVAMVFQSYALYPHMTVRENMEFGLKIRKAPADEIRLRTSSAAKLLDIEPLLDRLPKQLSGGQRQRVAIGRAIVRQPDVFLFDEPLSNLDAALRTQMRVELKKLHRELGTTMIYVTHDQVEAMTLADRIAILRDGLLQQVGTPGEVYDTPANRFVASFIGSPSMNFLDVDTIGNGVPDGAVEVGIRPQHLERTRPDGDSITLTATVEVIEPMGWEAYVHAHVGDEDLVAHLRTEQLGELRPGDALDLWAPAHRLHFFDAAGAVL
jgi:ABC-type sugar transport system ATPase subunit